MSQQPLQTNDDYTNYAKQQAELDNTRLQAWAEKRRKATDPHIQAVLGKNPAARILVLFAGDSSEEAKLAVAYPEAQIYTVESLEAKCKIARNKYGNIKNLHIYQGNVLEINKLGEEFKKPFDVILISLGWLHLHAAILPVFAKSLVDLLKAGSKLIMFEPFSDMVQHAQEPLIFFAVCSAGERMMERPPRVAGTTNTAFIKPLFEGLGCQVIQEEYFYSVGGSDPEGQDFFLAANIANKVAKKYVLASLAGESFFPEDPERTELFLAEIQMVAKGIGMRIPEEVNMAIIGEESLTILYDLVEARMYVAFPPTPEGQFHPYVVSVITTPKP